MDVQYSMIFFFRLRRDFKTLVVSVAAAVALAEIGAVRPCRTSSAKHGSVVPIVKAHLEYTVAAIAVCRRRRLPPSPMVESIVGAQPLLSRRLRAAPLQLLPT